MIFSMRSAEPANIALCSRHPERERMERREYHLARSQERRTCAPPREHHHIQRVPHAVIWDFALCDTRLQFSEELASWTQLPDSRIPEQIRTDRTFERSAHSDAAFGGCSPSEAFDEIRSDHSALTETYQCETPFHSLSDEVAQIRSDLPQAFLSQVLGIFELIYVINAIPAKVSGQRAVFIPVSAETVDEHDFHLSPSVVSVDRACAELLFDTEQLVVFRSTF